MTRLECTPRERPRLGGCTCGRGSNRNCSNPDEQKGHGGPWTADVGCTRADRPPHSSSFPGALAWVTEIADEEDPRNSSNVSLSYRPESPISPVARLSHTLPPRKTALNRGPDPTIREVSRNLRPVIRRAQYPTPAPGSAFASSHGPPEVESAVFLTARTAHP